MEQKRKSSLAQNAGGDQKKEDDQTVELTRLKRRISFSEKKSIRVFSTEEETKAWNLSYEISDRGDPSNNTIEYPTNSSENRTHSISGLCTTNEFIEKTYRGDLYIENSLGITLSEFEMRQKKQNSKDSVKELNLNSMGKPIGEKLSEKTSITAKQIESNVLQLQPEQPHRNSAAPNFIYLNENSNKENIEPEIIEIFNAKTNKPDEESQVVEDFDASDGPYHKHMKQQSTSQRHATTTSNQNQCSNQVGIGRDDEVLQNISGVCSIDSPISFVGRYFSDDPFSPLIPQDILPSCSKKISFQQLNEEVANGHLKLFPPTTKSGLSRRVEKNQTVYTHTDIESTFVNNLHGAKARSSIKDPTTYFEIGIESTCMNNLKVSETKSRRTEFFDESIEIEDNKRDEKEFVPSKRELKIKSKFEKSKKEVSLMRSDDDSNHNKPMENQKKTSSNRRTIYFENDVMETENDGHQELDETMVREDVTSYTKVNSQNLDQPKPKLQFLQTTPKEQLELKGNAEMEEDSSKSKRYTHHFNNSGFIDITNNLIEVNKNFKAANTNISKVNFAAFGQTLLEKSDCIVPETEAMELSHEISMPQNDVENIPNNRRTKYFEQNDQIDITNAIRNAIIAETPLSYKTLNESYIGKTKCLNEFKEKRTECFIDETQRMDFTLESYKLPNEKVPTKRHTNYFDQIEEISTTMGAKSELYNSKALQNISKENYGKDSNCIIPEIKIIDLTLETPKTKKNKEIPIKRRTNYFDQNEPINITNIVHNDTEWIIPETQAAMDVSFVSPKCSNEIVDLPKNRRTHYFNQNKEINITHCSNENQMLFNATKGNAIKIEESSNSANRIEKNKQFKKVPEDRKTTYFGCDVSLNVTNKVNDMSESKYITPVAENMEFTNRYNSNFDQNEQINITKINHKDIECIVPETQAMNVSIKSSNLNNKIDLPKNRHTTYFNQNEEINIAHCLNENQMLFNATKPNAIQIEESFNSANRIEKNKQFKKVPEDRKTTYFGCDVSLNVTNKVNDMNESKYITPVTETMEFTNRYNRNFDQNEQINITKMNHKDIECIVPETQAMNVSIRSPNLNNKVDLPKNRHTTYFNQNEEINIAHASRENEKLFNATKTNAIQIEESFNAEKIIAESEQFKQSPESRKTTYFGFEESLNLTNIREETYVPLQYTTASKFMPEENEKISKYTENNDGHKKIYLNKALDDNDKPIGNRYTRIFNNSDVMNITLHTNKNSNPLAACHQLTIQDTVEKFSKNRYTEHFNNTDAIITSIEDRSPLKEQENNGNILNLNKHSCRKTLHFDSDNQMDVTEQENNENKKYQCLTRVYEQSMSIESQNNKELVKNANPSNKENCINDRSALLSSMIDEMEIDITPTCQLKTVRPSCFNDYNTYTPGRSILEFLRIEKEIEQEGENYPNEHSILTGSSTTESAKGNRNQKRSTSNLTPIFSNSKKRQSESCDNSLLKYPRSTTTTFNDNLMKGHEVEKENSTLKPIDFKENFLSCSFSYGQDKNIIEPGRRVDSEHTPSLPTKDIEISSKLTNEPITPRPRSEMRKSRIPTFTGSAKKKDISCDTSTNWKSINIPDSFSHSRAIEEARLARNSEEFHAQENNVSKLELSERNNITKEYNLQPEKYPIRKSIFHFEDQPITISDVSEHYLSLKQKRNSFLYKNKSKITNNNDKLTESLLEIIDSDDIDKIKLDLVETLLDESEDDDDDEKNDEIEENEHETPDSVIQLLKSQTNNERQKDGNSSKNSLFHLTLPEMENRNKRRNSFCRKCKCCKDVMLLNETVSSGENDSFIMPQMPSLDQLMDQFDKRMEKMTRGPTLKVVDEFWKRMQLQRAAEISDESSDEDVEYGEDSWITEIKQRSAQIEKNIQALLLKPMNVRKSFIDRLKDLLRNSPNWIMNAEMMLSQIITFRHKETYTICISLQYEKRDPFGDDVKIISISLEDSSVPKRIWTPSDFIIHFQLQLEVPHNLRSYCSGNSETDIYEMLIKLDEICRNTVQMSNELLKIVVEKKGRLIRENSQNLIRRVMRKAVLDSAGLYQSTQSQEIRIGVKDIKNVCFKDITMPPVYMFREEIQNIPAGLDFLRIFLNDSTLFLKNIDNPHEKTKNGSTQNGA